MYQGTGQGGRRKTQGCGGGSGHTHLATTDAHATVVELEFVQREAGGALEQGLEASHAVRPEGVVTQVQLHQLGPGRDESLPERDLGTEELVSVSQTGTRCYFCARSFLSSGGIWQVGTRQRHRPFQYRADHVTLD